MLGLLRYQIFTVYGIVLLAIWYGALQTQQGKDNPSIIVVYGPLWGIIALGIYALSSVIYGVVILKDVPDAAAEIDRQITEARAEMKKRGIIKDS